MVLFDGADITPNMSIALSNLTSAVTYDLRVFAVNAVGRSAVGSVGAFPTPAGPPDQMLAPVATLFESDPTRVNVSARL